MLYAVCYQQNIYAENLIPVALGRARVIAAARSSSGGTSGDRLTRLRQSQNLTRKSLALSTDISESRLSRLEGGEMPTGDELISLGGFFNVSADYILKGELNGK